jgi:DNA polymerase I
LVGVFGLYTLFDNFRKKFLLWSIYLPFYYLMTSKYKVYLVDAMALAYRSHFAMLRSGLRNADGMATGSIFGFANTLVKIIDQDKPSHLAVVWDTHAPTFRHQMDPSYKANRPPQPEELTIAIPIIKEMIDHFGIKNLESDGYEADDIIGTLAKQAEAASADVYLVTPDKDFMQLVDDHIKMLKPLNNGDGFDLIDRDGVVNYFGVQPEQVIDVLALIGDTSDNVPGVPGIGKKGAPELILQYGSIEKLIEAAPEISSKRVREGITENAEQALKSRELVTIKTDVPDIISWKSLQWEGPDTASLGPFFKRMGFRTLMQRYGGASELTPTKPNKETTSTQPDLFTDHIPADTSFGSSFQAEDVDYQIISNESELLVLAAYLHQQNAFCFDTETTGLSGITSELVGISISTEAKKAWYIPVMGEKSIDLQLILKVLGPVFLNPKTIKIAHHHKYDYQLLSRSGFKLEGPIFDTMLAAYIIDSNQSLKMDRLSEKYLEYTPIPIDSLIGKTSPWKSMDQVPLDRIAPYACEDADITFRLYQVLAPLIDKDELDEVASSIEFPLSEVLAEMELKGVKIDSDMLKNYGKELSDDIREIEAKIYELAGCTFNLNSPAQLGDILFNKLNIPTGKKTSTGKFSTNEEVLNELAHHYEVPKFILEYRGLSKLKSTYVDTLPALVEPSTGRLHSSFNQSVAATGRLSSSGPNLQNIPIRTAKGREIRRAFIADDGYKLMSADYSQIELRIIASIANDVAMKEAFERGEDIHARTAAEVFGLTELTDVTQEQRRKAKEVNFGIPYGVSAFGLAQRLGISNMEGRQMIEAYFNRFPGIKEYISETISYAKDRGYVKTLTGRRRYIPDINSGNAAARGFAERTAINMPIQGTAADLIKIAMIAIHRFLKDGGYRSRMLLQVHDELVFEIHESELDQVPVTICRLMEEAMPIGVPLKVEMGIADNWLDAH